MPVKIKSDPTPIAPVVPVAPATQGAKPRPRLQAPEGFVAHWGVDSVTPAFANIGTESLYDFVARVAGRKPEFWARYIGNYQITTSEAAFLHSKNCAIFLVYNWVNAGIAQQGYESGVSQANIAINQCQALGVPQNVCIFCDIERDWWPSADFMAGWSDTMRASRYYGAGGFYGNPIDPGFDQAYNSAFTRYPIMREKPVSLVWSNEPDFGDMGARIPTWGPNYPETNPDGTVMWQYSIDVPSFGRYVDLNLCSSAAFAGAWRAVIRAQILHTLALKPTHDHESQSIKTLLGGSIVEKLSEQTVTDTKTRVTETWYHVSVSGKNGWVPATAVRLL